MTIAKDFEGKEETLVRKISKDKYMFYAVRECHQSLKYVLEILIVGSQEKR
jgi:callose synthase